MIFSHQFILITYQNYSLNFCKVCFRLTTEGGKTPRIISKFGLLTGIIWHSHQEFLRKHGLEVKKIFKRVTRVPWCCSITLNPLLFLIYKDIVFNKLAESFLVWLRWYCRYFVLVLPFKMMFICCLKFLVEVPLLQIINNTKMTCLFFIKRNIWVPAVVSFNNTCLACRAFVFGNYLSDEKEGVVHDALRHQKLWILLQNFFQMFGIFLSYPDDWPLRILIQFAKIYVL